MPRSARPSQDPLLLLHGGLEVPLVVRARREEEGAARRHQVHLAVDGALEVH